MKPCATRKSCGIPDAPRPSATLLIQRALLEHYGPPTVVVDRTRRIVVFPRRHGRVPRSAGRRADARSAAAAARAASSAGAHRAAHRHARQRRGQPSQCLIGEAGSRAIEITAAPLISSKAPDYYRVSFARVRDGRAIACPPRSWCARPPADEIAAGEERRLLRLELQSATEAYEATNEELKAAHEEATSMNEELQSANEELETSKEELQSINEELTTVNAQLQAKIVQLEATTNDIANLLSSTDIAVVFLDAEFRVRRFTPAVTDLLELIDTDIGRPVTDLAQKFTDDRSAVGCAQRAAAPRAHRTRSRKPQRPLVPAPHAAIPHFGRPHRRRGHHVRGHRRAQAQRNGSAQGA